MKAPVSRRAFLRGVLGGAVVTVGLPMLDLFLDDHGEALATGEAFPLRFGLFFWGNGVIPAKWVPAATGYDWPLSEQLAPLAGVKGDVSVVSGTAVKVPNNDPHYAGASGVLSGAPLVLEGAHRTFPSASVDQIIASAIGGQTTFRSLEFGAAPGDGLSYNGRDNLNPPELSPKALFDRVFGGGFSGVSVSGGDARENEMRRSVLDAVAKQAQNLARTLGKHDRERLEQHLDGIRELETRIGAFEGLPDLAACATPSAPASAYPDIGGRPQLSAINRAMVDVVAMALACDQVRVVSNFFSHPASDTLYPGASAGHHQLTHDDPGEQPEVNAIVKQIMAEYAYMVAKLKSIPEGEATLLDHCILLGTTDVALGRIHTLDDFPILIAGTGGGKLKKGHHYRSASGENTSKVMLSIMHALDIPADSFGADEGLANTGLRGIEA